MTVLAALSFILGAELWFPGFGLLFVVGRTTSWPARSFRMVTWHSVGSFCASAYLESVKPARTTVNGNRVRSVSVRLWLLHALLNFRHVWSPSSRPAATLRASSIVSAIGTRPSTSSARTFLPARSVRPVTTTSVCVAAAVVDSRAHVGVGGNQRGNDLEIGLACCGQVQYGRTVRVPRVGIRRTLKPRGDNGGIFSQRDRGVRRGRLAAADRMGIHSRVDARLDVRGQRALGKFA